MKVDVILPAHRGEPWIAEAVESVLGQTWPDWHLTVVDDASPDATAEHVERLAREHPGRISLVRLERPRRAAGARMLAVERTSCDVIAFLDQDDRWLPEKLERQVALLASDPELGAVHTDIEVVDAAGAPIPGAADRENARRAALAWGSGTELACALFQQNSIRLVSAAVRRSAFEAVGGFDTSLFGGEDWEFWVRFAARFRIGHLPQVLCQRRVHGGNVSRLHRRERTLGKLRALEKMERACPWLGPRVEARRKALRDQLASGGVESRPLELCRALFDRLEREGIRYCHWKSNEHVLAALAGRTDFDLLVAGDARERFEAALDALGFKRIVSPPERRFPGMEDRLGFDDASGRLVHLHVHYRLILGTPGAKNHHLPFEALLLDSARELHGVKAPLPELEFLLLLIRAPLKISPLRIARRWRRDGTKTLPSSLVREIEFLAAEVDEERFRERLAATGLPLAAEPLLEFAEAVRTRTLTTPQLRRMRARVLRALRPYRRAPAWRAALRAVRARLLQTRPARRWLGPRAKTLPGPGPILALVGADGSGKTTLARDLCDWLGWKLRVEGAYFGIPKRSLRYRLLRGASRRLASPWLDAGRWILTARRRLAERRRAERIAARGGVVIADRYPLPELWAPPEPMDGPRLAEQRMGARERAIYARIPPPSKVFVLRADLAVLRRRKGDVDPAIHARKVRTVEGLEESELFSRVDANRPYEQVLLDLKRRIWDLL